MRPVRAALLAVAALLAGCGDTLVDHRNVGIQEEAPLTCQDNLVQCGTECRTQDPTKIGYVCGTSCTPCAGTLPDHAVRTCTTIGLGGHDGVCGYDCAPGYLKCDAGCCAPALVAAGGEFACATTAPVDGGEVHCWGAGALGQLGDGLAADRSTSARVPGLAGVTALAAGAAHACAVSGATTSCWGDRAGFGGSGQANVPEAIAPLAGATVLSAGAAHTCAVIAGAVTCTGAAISGGGTPALVGTPLEIAAGAGFSCALMSDGVAPTVWCWGDDTYGQLGRGTSGSASATPIQVSVPATIQHVAAGTRHACASNDQLPPALALHCWGSNDSYQLGTFPTTILPPTANDRIKKPVSSISAGGLATCAVEQDPTAVLSCWTQDDFAAGGSFPDGEPNHIGSGDLPGMVSVGGAHTCFVEAGPTLPDATRRLRCFGHDERGQLGDGGTTPTNSSVSVLVVDH